MTQPKKLTIGARFTRKIFKLSSVSGRIIDDLLESRDRGKIKAKLEHFRGSGTGDFVQLQDESGRVTINVDSEAVTVALDVVKTGGHVDFDEVRFIFQETWRITQLQLNNPFPRRIGIAGEFWLDPIKNPSGILASHFLKDPPTGTLAKYVTQFERRFPDAGGPFDPTKSVFLNVIQGFYDAELDVVHAKSDAIVASLDVQRYFDIEAKINTSDELTKLNNNFNKEKELLDKTLTKLKQDGTPK